MSDYCNDAPFTPAEIIVYNEGYLHGASWEGLNGKGSFGIRSMEFIHEAAKKYGEYASLYMKGFWIGYRECWGYFDTEKICGFVEFFI